MNKTKKIIVRVTLFLCTIIGIIFIKTIFGENALTSASYVAAILHLRGFIKEIQE